jgi:toluene monooxygenase system protein E
MVEKLLVVYDWGETHVALNFVVLPAICEGVLRTLASSARRNSNSPFGLLIIDSELRDLDRNRRWTGSVVKYAVDHEPSNRAVVDRWIEKWSPPSTIRNR